MCLSLPLLLRTTVTPCQCLINNGLFYFDCEERRYLVSVRKKEKRTNEREKCLKSVKWEKLSITCFHLSNFTSSNNDQHSYVRLLVQYFVKAVKLGYLTMRQAKFYGYFYCCRTRHDLIQALNEEFKFIRNFK